VLKVYFINYILERFIKGRLFLFSIDIRENNKMNDQGYIYTIEKRNDGFYMKEECENDLEGPLSFQEVVLALVNESFDECDIKYCISYTDSTDSGEEDFSENALEGIIKLMNDDKRLYNDLCEIQTIAQRAISVMPE